MEILKSRSKQIFRQGKDNYEIKCETASTAGAVSQRACVFCGSRVVLYPIVDALHLVHGPIGCAAYTWDIRGAHSSGPELHRMSFSTDLREKDVIYGGEPKLYESLIGLIEKYEPKAAFVYSTCIVGVIGDDVSAICKKVSSQTGIPVLPVHSEGFKGTKKDGYAAACDALQRLIGTGNKKKVNKLSLNILGDFNIAGETWMIKKYYEDMGIEIVSTMTGDGRVEEIKEAHKASLNVVQCSGSMTGLAKGMQEKYGIPFIRVSYFGIEDMADALYEVARFFKDEAVLAKAQRIVKEEINRIYPLLKELKMDLTGKKAAIYTGGAFKAFSLIKSLRHLGMTVAVVGSQTGNRADYELLKEITEPGTIIVDDTNPVELSHFIKEKDVDLFIGGVKERPLAYKLGVGFCDHNHERKIALAGFEGMLSFAQEVHKSVMSPVWDLVPRRKKRGGY